METCSDPISYLQETLNEELERVLCGHSTCCSSTVFSGVSRLQVKRKLKKDGDAHIPAFTRQLERFKDRIKDEKFDMMAITQRISTSPTLNKYIKEINISTKGQLDFCFNKTAVTQSVITNVIAKGTEYGTLRMDTNCVQNSPGVTEEYILNGYISMDDSNHVLSSLDCLRTVITLGHVKNILSANSLSATIINPVLSKALVSNSQSVLEVLSLFNDTFTTRNEQDTDYQRTVKNIEQTLHESSFVLKCNGNSTSKMELSSEQSSNQSAEEPTESCDEKSLMYFDCHQYRTDCGFHQVNITRALILNVSTLEFNARPIDTQEHSCQLLHITSNRKLYKSQQNGLVWEALSYNPLAKTQTYMSLGMIAVHNNEHKIQEEVRLEQLLSIREGQLRTSYLLKYGDTVQGSGWDDSIRSVAVATLKLQIMTASQNNQVRIDVSKQAHDFRQSTFIMYNCARLSKLFSHYEQSVQQGLYPPLPQIEKIDFSLLREKDEWNLLLRYVMTYPSAVRDAIHGFLTQPRHDSLVTTNINKICCFLLEMSQDFSSYYGRTHILGEPRPHLFPTMFARLYLLKAIQQVFHNGLALLDIQPLTQM